MSRPPWDPERLEDHFSRGAGAWSSYHVSVWPGVRPGGQWNPDLSGGPELEHAASVLWEEWVKHSWVSMLIRVWGTLTFSRFKCHPSQLCLLFSLPLISYVLHRPWTRGALHTHAVWSQTLGWHHYPVQLHSRIHPAGRRHSHLLWSRTRHSCLDVSLASLHVWVPTNILSKMSVFYVLAPV